MAAILQRFTNVRKEEVASVVLATLFFYCILTALMILRPARDALGMQRGMDSVRWLFNLTLIATLLVNPLFAALVSRFRRIGFIAAAYIFFATNLAVFFGLLVFAPQAVGELSGQVFYVWMSVFNLFVTMIFWALMADLFTLEQAKRLFGVVAVGGTVGAITGSVITVLVVDLVGTPGLLLLAAGFLVLAVLLAWALVKRNPAQRVEHRRPDHPAEARAPGGENVIGGSMWEGFQATVRSPYLLGIAGYVLILAVLVTFVYFTRLQMVAAAGDTLDVRTGLFARMDMITQVSTLVLQLIITGHLMKRLGVGLTLLLLPLTVALGFVGLAIVGTMAFVAIFDAVFKAVQRGIMRPARETLFTVVPREDKYKAKALIDTFVYRAGDAVGAQTEGRLDRLGLGLTGLAAVAVPLALAWGALGVWLGWRQGRIAEQLRGEAASAVSREEEGALR